MKILVALTYYYPHWTGLTAIAQGLAEGLAAKGHQVTVVTSLFDRLPPREDHNGVHIVRLRSWFRLSRGQVMPSFVPVVHRLVREHDIVQVHTPMLETWLVGALAHLAGRKMVMTHSGDLVMPAGGFNQFVQRTVGLLLNRGGAIADVITTLNQDYANHSPFLRPFAPKVRAIYPPVRLPLPKMDEVQAMRRELGLEGASVVGFAGRFVEEKGFDYLLQAMPLVLAQMPGTKFAYAGEHRVAYERFFEQCRPLWEAQQDSIVMMGLIRDPQKLANYYAMCDAFVLPSRTDCFALVQVEAMLCGTPVVATNIPGAREVVQVTNMGLLVEPRSPQALAEGLVKVLRTPESYARSYEEIRSIFSTDKTIVAYEELFHSLIDSA
jgi:glycosyltransferase involved in cell wall biosynthesis